MHKNKLLIGSAAAIFALLLSGCGPAGDTGSEAPLTSAPSQSGDEATPPDDSEAEAGSEVDAQRAAELALNAVPGTVVELELDQAGSTLQWEVGVLADEGAGVEIHIDSVSGEVLNQYELWLSTAQQTAPKQTVDAAIKVALDAVGGVVTDASLDTENGRVVWEVSSFDDPTEWELNIDATTGEIIMKEQDR